MEYPVLVILGILAIGALFVVYPVVVTTLSDHKAHRGVTCPATGGPATISIDPGRAARGAVFGKVLLSVTECSLWPERKACERQCLRAIESPASVVPPQA